MAVALAVALAHRLYLHVTHSVLSEVPSLLPLSVANYQLQRVKIYAARISIIRPI